MRAGRLRVVALLASTGVAALATVASAGDPGRTLGRVHDPVVVSVGRLPGASGLRAAGFRLYRGAEGGLEPIPFQLDPLDANGLVVPGVVDDRFTVDADDELVFMAMDAGERVERPAVTPEAERILEIEVRDPASDRRGWVYLAYFPGEPPRPAGRRYVWLEPATHEVRSEFYQVRYGDGRNFFTAMHVLPAAGGSGRNLLVRTGMRARPTFRFLLKTWSFEFTEENQRAELEAVRVGPVRVTRRFRMRIDLGRFFPEMPAGTIQTAHYRSSFVTPSEFSIPGLALKVLHDVEVENLAMFRGELPDMRFFDANHPRGLPFTGSSRMEVEDRDDHDWWVASGPDGSFLTSFQVPDEWLHWGVRRGTTVVGGAPEVHEAADERRTVHAAGYTLENMTQLRRGGDYQLEQATVVLPRRYQPGDERGAMAMLRDPLAVSVLPVAPTGVAGAGPEAPAPAARPAG